MTLETILAQYGILALFVGAAVEGETVVVLGGVMVHRGVIPFDLAILAAAMGSFVADQIFFSLGRKFRSHRFVRRLQDRAAYSRALATFDKHPTLFVFGFRFLYGLRTVSPIAIGTTTLAFSRFLVINALAATVWSVVFVTLGYFFGHAVEAAFGHVRDLGHVVLPILAILLVMAGAIHLLRRRRGNKPLVDRAVDDAIERR